MTYKTQKHSLIFDVGKTHVKLHIMNEELESLHSKRELNKVINEGQYPHADVDWIWNWLISGIKETAKYFNISAISITTHGATAALINRDAPDSGLTLPVLDYEYDGLKNNDPEYLKVRPDFSDTYSPDLPCGLNIGRQLYWQANIYPTEFKAATDILMYPQYWAWRLSGVLSTEVTSLGCHTDLWSPERGDYSTLINQMDLRAKFPEIVPAWKDLGFVKQSIITETGLSEDCRVFAGIHDSNASFLRYRVTHKDTPFTVISTGTWTILMASGVSLDTLDPSRDMLANVDATGKPIACARFMGGREFYTICREVGADIKQHLNESDLQNLIDNKIMALPDFSGGSGPFGNNKSQIIGNVTASSGAALATLYCALMIDYQLDMLKVKEDIFIEGAFLKNPQIIAILGQLRPEQPIWLSADNTGTVQGCAHLTQWNNPDHQIALIASPMTKLNNLTKYRDQWRSLAEAGRPNDNEAQIKQ